MASTLIAAILTPSVIDRIVTDLGLQARALARVQAQAHAACSMQADRARRDSR